MIKLPKFKKIVNPPFLTIDSNEEGIASIVVVGFLIILLTIISLGFTRLMNRSLQNTAADQQSSAANYAAQSGINSTAVWLEETYINQGRVIPADLTPKCNTILNPGAVDPDLGFNTKLTCVLVDASSAATTDNLTYSDLRPYQSKIVKIKSPGNAVSSLKLFWRTSNSSMGSHRNYVGGLASDMPLLTEPNWTSNNYAPLLRVTIYPIDSNSGDLSLTAANAHTFFLYPKTSGVSNPNIHSDTTGTGSLWPVACSQPVDLTDTTKYDCNVNFAGFPIAGALVNNEAYYLKITPLYAPAAVQLKVAGGSTNIVNGQTIIDVTAKSGFAVKRLRARVSLAAGDKIVPDAALRSADTLCKRYNITAGPTLTVEDSTGSCFSPL